VKLKPLLIKLMLWQHLVTNKKLVLKQAEAQPFQTGQWPSYAVGYVHVCVASQNKAGCTMLTHAH